MQVDGSVRREGSPFASPLVADRTDVPEMRAAIDYVVFVLAFFSATGSWRCGQRALFCVYGRHGARRKGVWVSCLARLRAYLSSLSHDSNKEGAWEKRGRCLSSPSRSKSPILPSRKHKKRPESNPIAPSADSHRARRWSSEWPGARPACSSQRPALPQWLADQSARQNRREGENRASEARRWE